MYSMLINDALVLLFSFIGILTSFIYIFILFFSNNQQKQKIRSIPNLLAANSCIAGFLLNTIHFIDGIIAWQIDTDMIKDTQQQANYFCVLRGSLRTAFTGTMYYSLCIQAFDRLNCIVYSKRLPLHSRSIYIYLIIIQWILSIGSVLPLVLFDQIVYNSVGHFCQITIDNPFAFLYVYLLYFFLPFIIIICIYMKIIIYLRHRSIIERFRRRKAIQVLRHIVNMLIILSLAGIPIGIIFLQTRINHRIIPNNAQKFAMIFVSFSHATVMIYTLILTADVRRNFIQSLIVPYRLRTDIEDIKLVEIKLSRLKV